MTITVVKMNGDKFKILAKNVAREKPAAYQRVARARRARQTSLRARR